MQSNQELFCIFVILAYCIVLKSPVKINFHRRVIAIYSSYNGWPHCLYSILHWPILPTLTIFFPPNISDIKINQLACPPEKVDLITEDGRPAAWFPNFKSNFISIISFFPVEGTEFSHRIAFLAYFGGNKIHRKKARICHSFFRLGFRRQIFLQ